MDTYSYGTMYRETLYFGFIDNETNLHFSITTEEPGIEAISADEALF